MYGTRHAIVRSVQMVAQTGLISLARFARARTVGLPTDRYDRNFDLTSIYRDRSYERVGRHSCLSQGANNSVGGAAVTFVISMAECFRVPRSWLRLVTLQSFSCLIVKEPWWNRDDRRGDGIVSV